MRIEWEFVATTLKSAYEVKKVLQKIKGYNTLITKFLSCYKNLKKSFFTA